MLWSIALMFVFGLATTSPIESNSLEQARLISRLARSGILETQLKNLIEEFRKTMINGSDDIPVLDPFYIEYLAIDDSVVPVPGLKFETQNTTLYKLSTFVVKELKVERTSLLPLRYKIQLYVHNPTLEIDARNYELQVPVQGISIFGKGDAVLHLIRPSISGYVIARPVIGLGTLFVRLEECQLKIGLKRFRPNIRGLLGGSDSINEFINIFLSHLVPDLIKHYEEDISRIVSKVVKEVGNELLAEINLIGIIGSS